MPSDAGRRILLGLLLVVIGASILSDRLGRLEGNLTLSELLWRWWPLTIVVAGCIGLLRSLERPWQLIRPLTAIAAGTTLLLVTSGVAIRYFPDVTDQSYPLLWPAAVVLVGFRVALAGVEWSGRSRTGEAGFHTSVWLRGDSATADGGIESGGVRVVLGYLWLDLSKLPPTDKLAVLDVTAVLGRVHIVVPNGFEVERREAFVVGGRGLHYTSEPPKPRGKTRLMVNLVAVFGDVVVEESTAAPPGGEESRAAS